MIQLNLSLRTPLKYQHLASKYGGHFFFLRIRNLPDVDPLFSEGRKNYIAVKESMLI